MPEHLQIVESTDLTRPGLETFYDAILGPSFDGAELEDRTALLDALADPESASPGSIALDADGQIVGGMVGDWFAESQVLLISYLAARPGLRGHGLGGQMIREVLPAWTQRFGALLTVAEVENPQFYQNDEGHGDPEARLRFYAKFGAKIVPAPYFQPALSPDQPRVRNLFLMILSADPSARRGRSAVDATTLRAFVEEYVTGSEGDVHDDEVQALRAALRGKDVIELLDPSQFLSRDKP